MLHGYCHDSSLVLLSFLAYLHCTKTSASIFFTDAQQGYKRRKCWHHILFLLSSSWSGRSKTTWYQCACCLSMSWKNSAGVDLSAWLDEFIITGRLSWKGNLLWWKEYRFWLILRRLNSCRERDWWSSRWDFAHCDDINFVGELLQSTLGEMTSQCGLCEANAELSTPLMILHQYKHEADVRGNMLQCLQAWKRPWVCSSTCPLPNRLDIDYHRINAPSRPTIVTQKVAGIYVQYANNTQNINTMNIVSSSLYEFKISDSVGNEIAEAHSPLKRQWWSFLLLDVCTNAALPASFLQTALLIPFSWHYFMLLKFMNVCILIFLK